MSKKHIEENVLNFNAVFAEESDGGYSVTVPALPGCGSQGDTFEEAVTNIQEAIELYLEDEELGDIPSDTVREFIVTIEVHGR